MQMVKVSVILPIYNVAPYLEETFESLIHQTLSDIEIIAVNDGSTDHSEDIIQKYQQQDARIISLSQKNQGQSTARRSLHLMEVEALAVVRWVSVRACRNSSLWCRPITATLL